MWCAVWKLFFRLWVCSLFFAVCELQWKQHLLTELGFIHTKHKHTVLSSAFPSIRYGCSQQRSCSFHEPGKRPSHEPPHTRRAFSHVTRLRKQMKPVYRDALKTFNMLLSAYSLTQPQSPSLLSHPSLTAALQITQRLWNTQLVLSDSLLSECKTNISCPRPECWWLFDTVIQSVTTLNILQMICL